MLHYKNQAGISWGLLSLCIALPLVLSQQPLLAQGFVAVVSNPTEVAKTNRSALSGTLLFAVSAASAGPGEIVIDYGIPIEDAGVVSDDPRVSIDETDLASGILTVRFLEEINTGEVLTLSGVRLVTFPDSVPSTVSRATLTVAEGSETKLPTEDDDRTITYEFTPQVASNRRVEAFQLDYTVEMDTPEDESTDNSQPPAGRPVAAEPTAVFLQER